ncbi:hypothetical protein DPMN_075937 [Dreissena polymorpha]|uniref:Uncharacterized protein n=1 Tax=Dreissena polymorpha TaxID=45954 RepID=A0A9D3YLD4_DREPO|nr:hypothetical protein DPMN_075937 [Dreissena polymorpha]
MGDMNDKIGKDNTGKELIMGTQALLYREVTGSIPTVGAFFKSLPKTPKTGSRPRKRTRERLYKP